MGRRAMSETDAQQVVAGIEATGAALGPDTRARYYAMADEIQKLGGVGDLSVNPTPEVLAAMLNPLPVEHTTRIRTLEGERRLLDDA
jgi:hypothetical protein